MTADRSDGARDGGGRAIQAERCRVSAWQNGRQASREAARAGIDWSLLALLLTAERGAPIAVLGDDLRAIASALASAGARVIPLHRQREGFSAPATGQGEAEVFPVCKGAGGTLPLLDGSMAVTILSQFMVPPLDGGESEAVSIDLPLLTQIHRVLRPGGMLCLILSRRRCGLRPAMVRACLAECGFLRNDLYLVSPGHRRFTALLPMVCRRAAPPCIDLAIQGNASRERWLRAWLKILATLGLLKYRAAEYVALGWKGM